MGSGAERIVVKAAPSQAASRAAGIRTTAMDISNGECDSFELPGGSSDEQEVEHRETEDREVDGAAKDKEKKLKLKL